MQTPFSTNFILFFYVSQYHHFTFKKNRPMHTLITNTTLITLSHSIKFQPSNGHPQRIWQIQFNSKAKKWVASC